MALTTVHGLDWPYDGDHFRDVAQAQTTLDGHPLSDPFYAGEWVWYNPLVPWLVAAVSAISRSTPALVHVQGGPWFNLLGPIAFYLLCVRLAGRSAALIALALMLFVNCRTDPSLTCATYSPWLFVATFTQGLFFLAVIAVDAASTSERDIAAVIVGALAGLTFLSHTAPALVLAGIALLTLRRRALVVSGVVALLVSSPFVWSIAVHYHLHVQNSAPMAWAWGGMTRSGVIATLTSNLLLLGVAVAGLFVVRRRVVDAWLAVAIVLMAYGLLREGVLALPAFVPTFHFWRYVVAAATLLAGAAVAKAIERTAGRMTAVVVPLGVAALVWWMLPQYRSRFDFGYGRAIAMERSADLKAASSFIHRSVPEDAVVLGSRGLSLEVIAPAGRRVVGVNANWSNPYVANGPRVAARDGMLATVNAHAFDAFNRAADANGVSHAVGMGDAECASLAGAGMQLLYRFGEVCVMSRHPDAVR